mmetsp:Transcript_41804/g.130948  ORF Transcript_41804/g.130948 Transcript_41804/m.130948 type:complete len:462 (+) Transcript_41804:534-1919(+)
MIHGRIEVEREVLGRDARDVRRGHARAGNGVGGRGAANPRGRDVHTRGVDVRAGAIVAEARLVVIDVRGVDGDDVLRRGRREGAGVEGAVARGDDDGDARSVRGLDGQVAGVAVASAEAHVRDGRFALLGGLLRDPRDALDDAGDRAAAEAVEDADGNEVHVLGEAVGLAADRARHVRPMAVLVRLRRLARGADAPGGAALELVVLQIDARVNDVHIDLVLRRAEGVDVGVRSLRLARRRGAHEPPIGVNLAGALERLHAAVLLDHAHDAILIVEELLKHDVLHAGGEADEASCLDVPLAELLEGVVGRGIELQHELPRSGLRGVRVQQHNVLALDDLLALAELRELNALGGREGQEGAEAQESADHDVDVRRRTAFSDSACSATGRDDDRLATTTATTTTAASASGTPYHAAEACPPHLSASNGSGGVRRSSTRRGSSVAKRGGRGWWFRGRRVARKVKT